MSHFHGAQTHGRERSLPEPLLDLTLYRSGELRQECVMERSGHRPFLRWRRESIIDVYQIALGLFLFTSPWLFAYARSVSRIDAWSVSLAIIAISVVALIAFS